MNKQSNGIDKDLFNSTLIQQIHKKLSKRTCRVLQYPRIISTSESHKFSSFNLVYFKIELINYVSLRHSAESTPSEL